VKHTRRGETLWSEWTGELYDKDDLSSVVFYTVEHIDVENEVVRRALASAIQREGVVDSLGEAFKLIDEVHAKYLFAGEVRELKDYAICNDKGETFLGDNVEEVVPITIVEI
jgi:hypothetical protein